MDSLMANFMPVALENYELEKRHHKNNVCIFSHYRLSSFEFKEKNKGLFDLRVVDKYKTPNYYLHGKFHCFNS